MAAIDNCLKVLNLNPMKFFYSKLFLYCIQLNWSDKIIATINMFTGYHDSMHENTLSIRDYAPKE